MKRPITGKEAKTIPDTELYPSPRRVRDRCAFCDTITECYAAPPDKWVCGPCCGERGLPWAKPEGTEELELKELKLAPPTSPPRIPPAPLAPPNRARPRDP